MIMKSVSSATTSTENESLTENDLRYMNSLYAIELFWDKGHYEDAENLAKNVLAYKESRDRIKNSDLIS